MSLLLCKFDWVCAERCRVVPVHTGHHVLYRLVESVQVSVWSLQNSSRLIITLVITALV